jgi:hypothetical protein
MFRNENAMVCNQRYSSMSLTFFMKMCELPVIYHTFFVNYITSRNIYNNIIIYFLCYSGRHKSL